MHYDSIGINQVGLFTCPSAQSNGRRSTYKLRIDQKCGQSVKAMAN